MSAAPAALRPSMPIARMGERGLHISKPAWRSHGAAGIYGRSWHKWSLPQSYGVGSCPMCPLAWSALVLSQRCLDKTKREALSLRNTYKRSQGYLREEVYREMNTATTPRLISTDQHWKGSRPQVIARADSLEG